MTLPSTFLPDNSDSLAMERRHPVVLVIRHPEMSDKIELFGLPAETRIEYLDLGSSFDISHPDHWGRSDASDWVEGHLEQISELPSVHGARKRIEGVVADVCAVFGLDTDGSIPDFHPEWGSADDTFAT